MRAIFAKTLGLVFFVSLAAITAANGESASTDKSAKSTDITINNNNHLKTGEYDSAYDNYMAGNYKTAFMEALRRAEDGDPTAQTLLGRMYMEGYAVTVDGARAALWFGRAAKQGDPQAELRYGLLLFNGDYVKKDQKEGEDYVRQAVEAGVPEAYFYYGQLLMNKVDSDEALELGLSYFLKGAARGNPDCAYAASQILARGTPKRPRDDNNARKLLEAAAAKDHVPAQLTLAKWMIEGRGGPRDYEGAFNLLLTDASKMIAPAQINLARLYRDGIGTNGDIVKAAAWYMVAKMAKMEAPDLESMLEGMSDEQLAMARQEAAKLMPTL
ncbi:tetratricopeptide repeat protein [uncultured Bartonella sp.]|uniref:tetratricopeptide repeat protein n=1 Tax=uncultured Bartonella sp. TaxID=104108 RepID=UPI0026129405|nr:tetratricopeptide repeat protein [uncultured Bartonella sp.]